MRRVDKTVPGTAGNAIAICDLAHRQLLTYQLDARRRREARATSSELVVSVRRARMKNMLDVQADAGRGQRRKATGPSAQLGLIYRGGRAIHRVGTRVQAIARGAVDSWRRLPGFNGVPGSPRRFGSKTAVGRWWYDLPVRWQLMVSISIISIGAVLLSILLAVVDARSRVEVEVTSSMELAQQLVKDMVKRLASDGQMAELLDVMPEQLKYVRHARILVSDGHGELVQVAPDRSADRSFVVHPERAPQ